LRRLPRVLTARNERELLARKIKASQEREIKEFKAWLARHQATPAEADGRVGERFVAKPLVLRSPSHAIRVEHRHLTEAPAGAVRPMPVHCSSKLLARDTQEMHRPCRSARSLRSPSRQMCLKWGVSARSCSSRLAQARARALL
jgi:hypothetical protein